MASFVDQHKASLRISIHRAADLIPADSNGLADPYLMLYHIRAGEMHLLALSGRAGSTTDLFSLPTMPVVAASPEKKAGERRGKHSRSASTGAPTSPTPKTLEPDQAAALASPPSPSAKSGKTSSAATTTGGVHPLVFLLDPELQSKPAEQSQWLPSTKQKSVWQLVCKTATIFKTLSPAWEVTTYLPSVSPGDVLYFEVIDYDRFSKDDFQGCAAMVLNPAEFGTDFSERELRLRPQGSVFVSVEYGPAYDSPQPKMNAKKAVKSNSTVQVYPPPQLRTESSSLPNVALESLPPSRRAELRQSMLTSLANVNDEVFSLTLTVHNGVDLAETTDTFVAISLVSPAVPGSSSSSSSASGVVGAAGAAVASIASMASITTSSSSSVTSVSSSSSVSSTSTSSMMGTLSAASGKKVVAKAASVKMVSRSAIDRTGNPAWEVTCCFPNFYARNQVLVQVMVWKQGSKDKLLGERTLDAFSYPMTSKERVRLDLLSHGGKTGAKGSIFVSYSTGEAKPGLGTTTIDLNARRDLFDPEARQTAGMELHSQNYGVKVPNFRDIGGWPCRWRDPKTGIAFTGRMRTRMIMRSSAIHRATQNDARIITDELGIKTFFDLRTPDYAGNRGPYLTPLFKVKEYTGGSDEALWRSSRQDIVVDQVDFENVQRSSFLDQRTKLLAAGDQASTQSFLEDIPFDFQHEDAAQASSSSASSGTPRGTLYLQGLVGTQFKRAMVLKTKKSTLLKVVGKEPQVQRRMICGPIFDPSDGISVLYQMLIEECQSEFLLLMKSFLEPEVAVYPLAYFCNHGKDRTGMTTMFLQAVCGVDRQTMIDNYALSEYFLKPIQDIVDAEMVDGGLTPDVMSRTPSQAMIDTFVLLDEKYGGVLEYLNYIGFTFDLQAKLREKLVDVDDCWQHSRLKFRKQTLRNRSWPEVQLRIHSAVGLPAPQGSKTEYVVKVRQSSSLNDDKLAQKPKLLTTTPARTSAARSPVWEHVVDLKDIDSATRFILTVATADDQDLARCTLDLDELGGPTGQKISLVVKPVKVGRRVSGHLLVSVGLPASAAPGEPSAVPLSAWLEDQLIRPFEETLVEQGIQNSAALRDLSHEQAQKLASFLSERFLTAIRAEPEIVPLAQAVVSGSSTSSITPERNTPRPVSIMVSSTTPDRRRSSVCSTSVSE